MFKNIIFPRLLLAIFRASVGYPVITEIQKKTRESTDLEEYILLELKNIFQLQKFAKLRRAPFGQKC